MKLIVQTAHYRMFTLVKASSPEAPEGYGTFSLLTVIYLKKTTAP
jgi:hypothetical protein